MNYTTFKVKWSEFKVNSTEFKEEDFILVGYIRPKLELKCQKVQRISVAVEKLLKIINRSLIYLTLIEDLRMITG